MANNNFLYNVFKYSVKGIRYYSRGLRRKPLRVIFENNSSEQNQQCSDKHMQTKDELMKNIKEERDLKLKSQITQNEQSEIPPYEKLGENHGQFTKMLTALRSRKQREKIGKILLEGKRLINDAILAGAELECIYFSKEENLYGIRFDMASNSKLYKVFYKQLSLWSDLTTSPGIMGVFKRPDFKTLVLLNENTLPLSVICDNLRDPGNLGAVIRCGAAMGCQKIILMKGCADLWDPKVLRAGCGAHFRIPVINDVTWDVVSNYIPENPEIFLADNSIGSTENYNIRSYQKYITEQPSTEKYVERDGESALTVDPSYKDEKELKKYNKVFLPEYTYTDIKYDKDCVLLIGGETEGISTQAIKFASEFHGCRVTIPVENNVESLNSATSLAVIGFEVKRQFSFQNLTSTNE